MAKIIKLATEWTPEEEEQAAEIRAMFEEDEERGKTVRYVGTTYQVAVIITAFLFAMALMYKVAQMNYLAADAVGKQYGAWLATLYILPNIITVACLYLGVVIVLIKVPCWLVSYQQATRPHLRRCVYRRYSLRKAWKKELRWNVPAFLFLAVMRLLAGSNYHRLFEEGGAL